MFQNVKLIPLAIAAFLCTVNVAYSQLDNAGRASEESNGFWALGMGGKKNENVRVGKKRVAPADSAWNCLMEIQRSVSNDIKREQEGIISQAESKENSEKYIRKYFTQGLSFWRNYPDDHRKYKWVNSILLSYLSFWLDIEDGVEASLKSEFYSSPIDKKLVHFWRTNMEILQTEIKSSKVLTERQKTEYFSKDLKHELIISKNREYRGNKEDFLKRITMKLNNCLSTTRNNSSKGVLYNLNILFLGTNNYGLTFLDLSNLLRRYEKNRNAEIRIWVQQKMRLLELANAPMKFSGRSIKGKKISLDSLKGKVVLLDFWNIYCSTCIGRMPVIKAVYDKYKKSGFEVISMYAGPSSDEKEIEEIKKHLGIDEWPLVILGDKKQNGSGSGTSIWKEMVSQYGFQFVPQLLLLDKEGRMRILNGSLMDGDIETEVVELLEE